MHQIGPKVTLNCISMRIFIHNDLFQRWTNSTQQDGTGTNVQDLTRYKNDKIPECDPTTTRKRTVVFSAAGTHGRWQRQAPILKHDTRLPSSTTAHARAHGLGDYQMQENASAHDREGPHIPAAGQNAARPPMTTSSADDRGGHGESRHTYLR